jgi:hypothetical protein
MNSPKFPEFRDIMLISLITFHVQYDRNTLLSFIFAIMMIFPIVKFTVFICLSCWCYCATGLVTIEAYQHGPPLGPTLRVHEFMILDKYDGHVRTSKICINI